MKKEILVSVIIVFVVLFQSCCSPYIKVSCVDRNGNKNPVMILRDINKAYPVYARDYDMSIKTTIDILDKLKISDNDITYANKINVLRSKLSQETALMQDLIKSNCIALASRPCDTEAHAKFNDNINLLSSKILNLSELRNNINNSDREFIEITQQLQIDSLGQKIDTPKMIIVDTRQEKIIDEFIQSYNFLSPIK